MNSLLSVKINSDGYHHNFIGLSIGETACTGEHHEHRFGAKDPAELCVNESA
jgi:hypothetical protein